MTERELPGSAHVGRVTLRVTNLDRLANFYERVVGLELLSRDADRAVLGAGGEPLLELVGDPDAPERAPDETGLFHTAFLVPDRAALADALDRLAGRWLIDGASDHLVSEALYFEDPEGNGIEIYRDRPRDQWPTAPDGTVQMETRPLDLEELAAESGAAASAPPETTVGHVHLEVSSISAARDFYVDALGLRVRQEWADEALFVAAGDYHHHVGLNTWYDCTEPATRRGLDWFELVVPDADTLDAVGRRLDEQGVAWTATDDGLSVSDPDGIELRMRAAESN